MSKPSLERMLLIAIPAVAVGFGVTVLTGGLLGVPALTALGGGLFGGGGLAALSAATGAVASGLFSYLIRQGLDDKPPTVKGALVNVALTLGMTYAGLGILRGLAAVVPAAEVAGTVATGVGAEDAPQLGPVVGGLAGATLPDAWSEDESEANRWQEPIIIRIDPSADKPEKAERTPSRGLVDSLPDTR